MIKNKKVVIGLSGGVDSSVAAYLLKQEGYEVIGLFMVNWHDTTGLLSGDCPSKDDEILARLVARHLDIPFHKVDFSEPYRKRVVDYMFSEYEKGRTPNPDVLCNREIKFADFHQKALELGADFIATGHYCKKEITEINGNTYYRLLAGDDENKDQSYFLCQVSQKQLEKALFPIGHLPKPEVRRIASSINLPTAERKDSTGVCFVGKIDLPTFLQQKLNAKKGKIIEIPKEFKYPSISFDTDSRSYCSSFAYKPTDGKIVGEHNGAHFFTIGQRKGLNVGGTKEPLFVLATDVTYNIIYTGQGHDHPGLLRKGLFIPYSEVHWVRNDLKLKPNESKSFDIRIRYRQALQKGIIHDSTDGLYILFEESQRGITPGQFAAWYVEQELIGSGVIS